ncbi:sphingosine 1-phosphate receptor 1-like [Oculina patagonica]
MLDSAEIVFIVIFALEAAAIITGNVFTIFVFWTQRTHLKRAYFLLINLAVADLVVGVTETISLGTEKVPKMKAVRMEDVNRIKNPLLAFELLGSSTSVIFLALISLERAHAVLRPLRHRVINTYVYIGAIVIAWTAGLCIAGTYLLATYHTEVGKVYGFVAIHSFLFMCVLLICASYITTRCRRTRLLFVTPEMNIHNRRATEQNLRLSRTFFIVAAVSLVFWLPAVVVYIVREFCRKECFSKTMVAFVNCLHLANSMVNPVVYCFKMPIFKNALKKCRRRRVENTESRPVPRNVKNEAVEFTTHL